MTEQADFFPQFDRQLTVEEAAAGFRKLMEYVESLEFYGDTAAPHSRRLSVSAVLPLPANQNAL